MHCTCSQRKLDYISLHSKLTLDCLQECCIDFIEASVEYFKKSITQFWMLETSQLVNVKFEKPLPWWNTIKESTRKKAFDSLQRWKTGRWCFFLEVKVKSLMAFLSFHLQMVCLLCLSPSAPWPWLACWQWLLTRWVWTWDKWWMLFHVFSGAVSAQ